MQHGLYAFLRILRGFRTTLLLFIGILIIKPTYLRQTCVQPSQFLVRICVQLILNANPASADILNTIVLRFSTLLFAKDQLIDRHSIYFGYPFQGRKRPGISISLIPDYLAPMHADNQPDLRRYPLPSHQPYPFPVPPTHFCIAIEEGEAWLLGDLNAIKQAYPRAKDAILNSYTNDDICGTWEKLADAVYNGGVSKLTEKGYHSIGAEKAKWAEYITPHMDVMNNHSQSFCYFRNKIYALLLVNSLALILGN